MRVPIKKGPTKSSDSVRISNSATYTIGGREYTTQDISRLRPQTKDVHTVSGMEYAPRQVNKPLENRSGVINTSVGTMTPSAAVHVRTEAYRPSAMTSVSGGQRQDSSPSQANPPDDFWHSPFSDPNPVSSGRPYQGSSAPQTRSQAAAPTEYYRPTYTVSPPTSVSTGTVKTSVGGASPVTTVHPQTEVSRQDVTTPVTGSQPDRASPSQAAPSDDFWHSPFSDPDPVSSARPYQGRSIPQAGSPAATPTEHHRPIYTVNPPDSSWDGPIKTGVGGVSPSTAVHPQTAVLRPGAVAPNPGRLPHDPSPFQAAASEDFWNNPFNVSDPLSWGSPYSGGTTPHTGAPAAAPPESQWDQASPGVSVGPRVNTAVPGHAGMPASGHTWNPDNSGSPVHANVGWGEVSPYGGSTTLTPEQVQDLRAAMDRMGATGNVTTGGMQNSETKARASGLTGSARSKAAENRVLTGWLNKGSGGSGGFVRSLGTSVKYNISTEAARALRKVKENGLSGRKALASGGKMLVGSVQHQFSDNDDLGSQTVAGAISAGTAGAVALKGAQTATEIGISGVKKVSNGVYEVATTVGRTTITIGRTAKTVIQKQVVPFSRDTVRILKDQARFSGLNETRIAHAIVNKVEAVKNAYYTIVYKGRVIKTRIVNGARQVKTAVDTTIRIVHGVATGTLTLNTTKAAMKAFRNRMIGGIRTGVVKTLKTAVGLSVRGVSKAASVAVFRGVPAAARFIKGSALMVGGSLMHSEDLGAAALGAGVVATDVAIKTAVVGMKTTGYTVKTAVKSGKAVYRGTKTVARAVRYVRTHGIRAGLQRAGVKAGTAIAKAGRSVVSLLLTGLKLLGTKLVLPLILIGSLLLILVVGIDAPVMAIATIFGGVFQTSDTGDDYDVREYLTDAAFGVPRLSRNYRQDLADEMQDSAGIYDVVRFYSNIGSSDVIDPTFDGVTSVFPTDEQLVNMLQPMFNAILLMEYELTPTEAQARGLAKELLEGLFRVTTVETTEQCGQALVDGSGSVTTHSCGEVHALADCPNFVTGTHSDFTCDECDSYYYICQGHKGSRKCGKIEHAFHISACYELLCEIDDASHAHGLGCYSNNLVCPLEVHTHSDWVSESNPGCYHTVKHSGELSSDCGNSTRHFRCTGYKYCEGHSVIAYTLNLDGVYALEKKYFTDPINRLSNIPEDVRTADEQQKLDELKDYHEIFREMSILLHASDLSGIEFVNGTRVGNQDVVNLAMSQLGQQGGQPYWSYYGFGSRVEWCACFVHWCMRNTPSATASYPTTANNAYCPTLASHFQSVGQWGDRNYTDLVAGDTIFFDWEGDGVTDHIGIVIGHDGTYVYTVEGNSGDVVRQNQYNIGSSVIYGYGLMNY